MNTPINAKMSFLVVDDLASMTQLISGQLKEIGFSNVKTALDGQPAWEILEEMHENEEPIEFLLVDWNMPKMTGIDLLKKCRADERFKNLPFLMVTAENNKDNIIAAVEAGVSNYVVKPFSREVLREKISKILNNTY